MSKKVSNLPLYIMGSILLVVVLYPLYFVVIASISDPGLVMNGEIWLWPRKINLDGYRALFEVNKIWVGYRNTIFYAIVGTFISMIITTPAAYALAQHSLKIRKLATIYFMLTMFFNGGLIPTYLIITNMLHLDDSIWVMIFPFCLNVYNMIIMRSFFENGLPRELWEAAQLDGCTHFNYLIKIALPLSKAVFSVILLYYLVGKWNEYFTALIYIRNKNLVPLQIVLRDILIQSENIAGSVMDASGLEMAKKASLIKYSSIVVSTLPMMILYPFMQKYFEKGVMIGAVKE